MNRRSLRVQWAVDEMSAKGDCYFYTFTTPDVVSCRELCRRWRSFINSRYWKAIYCKGSSNHYLMVFEKHTKGHGWHIHFVSNFRHNVVALRSFTTHCGFGRINAVYCGRHTDALGRYLGKYVSKQFSKRDSETKGIRLCNVSRGLITLSRIQVDSPSIDFVRRCLSSLPECSKSSRLALFTFFKVAFYSDLDEMVLRPAFNPFLSSRGFSFASLLEICKKNYFTSCV